MIKIHSAMIYQGSNLEIFLSLQILKNAFDDVTVFNDVNCYSLKPQA